MKKYITSFLFLLLISCTPKEDALPVVSFSGSTMGTSYSIKVIPQNNTNTDSLKIGLQNKIDSILIEVNRQMSTYQKMSEISQFNRFKANEWFPVSIDFANVISHAKRIASSTNRALDITVGPLVNLWGFGPENRPQSIPSDAEIKDRMKAVGIDKISANLDPPALQKATSSLYCDLSSIAKGYGVDVVGEFLETKSFKNYLVEIGGELRARGLNQYGKVWKIGISVPDISGRIQKVVYLNNTSMATSGDYWNYFEENGIRYSHTINPRTGKPIAHKLASVTVIHDSCAIADGLATAINVMGPQEGYNYALKNELPIYMIIRNNENNNFVIKKTPMFDKLLKLERE